MTKAEHPVLVDEWQVHPPVWDAVRRAVDRGANAGDFLLTGSAAPTKKPLHSGAGPIVQLRMRPMSLAERAIGETLVSLGALLAGGCPPVSGDSSASLEDYAQEITSSGFPGIRRLPERFRKDALDGYLAAVVDRDFPELGHVVRRPGTLRARLRAYAAGTSTTASYASILEAATPGDTDKQARTTTVAYRGILERMWLVEEVPAWTGIGSIMTALGASPKHQMCDPALAARLLNVSRGAPGTCESRYRSAPPQRLADRGVLREPGDAVRPGIRGSPRSTCQPPADKGPHGSRREWSRASSV